MNFRFVLTYSFVLLGLIVSAQCDVDYMKPEKHTIARTTVEGVPNMNHEAIVLISGLTEGKEITVPGDDISQAIKKLWEQDLFSDVAIECQNIDQLTGDIFLVIIRTV